MISIAPHPAKPGYYVVCLGGGTYEVDAETGFCNCPGFQFRGKCKHGQALADYLEAERACPLCHGYGAVALRNRYAGEAPPCVLCEGSGQKSHGLSDGDLRELFR